MSTESAPGRPDPLLAEQSAYYRAIAPKYDKRGIQGARGDELVMVLDSFRPVGKVLELACGPGTWTGHLLRHATAVTALDGSPEMLTIASGRIRDERVRFVQTDIFDWQPADRYDVVFFGFWLSHVPLERFASFWSMVGDCLEPEGRVLFLDDAYRTDHELVYGDASQVVRRRLDDGSDYRVVKVPHEPKALERRLAQLGWAIEVREASRPFFWGAGARSRSTRSMCSHL
ncbi:MAG: class I SAM-dependent methyltransferase [Solirubrobacteraceae bacterium]